MRQVLRIDSRPAKSSALSVNHDYRWQLDSRLFVTLELWSFDSALKTTSTFRQESGRDLAAHRVRNESRLLSVDYRSDAAWSEPVKSF